MCFSYAPALPFTDAHDTTTGGARDCDHWHAGAGFVTSHIAITLMYEQALQAVNPSIALPYWDVTIEGTYYDWNDFRTSSVFSDDWFGDAAPGNVRPAAASAGVNCYSHYYSRSSYIGTTHSRVSCPRPQRCRIGKHVVSWNKPIISTLTFLTPAHLKKVPGDTWKCVCLAATGKPIEMHCRGIANNNTISLRAQPQPNVKPVSKATRGQCTIDRRQETNDYIPLRPPVLSETPSIHANPPRWQTARTPTRGRFAYVPVMTDAREYSAQHNSYGLLRSAWNSDRNPFLTRHDHLLGMVNNKKPSGCRRYRDAYIATNW